MPDLKPCPFCGSLPEIIDRGDFIAVQCQNDNCPICDPITAEGNDKIIAIKKWNTRHDMGKKQELNRSELIDFMVIFDKNNYPEDYNLDPEGEEERMRIANTEIVDYICPHFSKPNGNGLVPLDKQSVEDAIEEAQSISDKSFKGKYFINCIADVLVENFGTHPKFVMPSMEDIEFVILNENKNLDEGVYPPEAKLLAKSILSHLQEINGVKK